MEERAKSVNRGLAIEKEPMESTERLAEGPEPKASENQPLEGEFYLLTIPLAELLEYANPLYDDPWSCGPIDPEDVLLELGFGKGVRKPPEYDDELYSSYEYNVDRIAYFLDHGWENSESDREPITVDIGIEGYTPQWLISDGNHRVAAATIRGDFTITVAIIGCPDKAEAVFLHGVDPLDYRGPESAS